VVWIILLLCWVSDLLQPLSAGGSTLDPIDLSKATNLKEVVFQCGSLSSEWVTMTLETIGSRHRDLQRICIHIPHILSYAIQEDGITIEQTEVANPGTRWLGLDRLLVQLWESRSIRPKVVYPRAMDGKRGLRAWAGYLLPEITKRGIIDLVEGSSGSQ
jgi:hypothetical protein